MSVFGGYSQYYDLLYKDKDYIEEVKYIHGLIQQYNSQASSILDLGCGTGHHAQLLAERGYRVYGVDLSSEMLNVAREKHSHPKVELYQQDVVSIRLGKKVDVVTSLFHVMSYQATNEALAAVFETATEHLNPSGIFIFDCWYGPAVLTERPEVRVKRLESEAMQVIRIAEPCMHPNENLVDVNYTVLVKDKNTTRIEELKETHRMRYLFKSEIEQYAKRTSFAIEASFEWMTGKRPGFDTWGVCFILKKY